MTKDYDTMKVGFLNDRRQRLRCRVIHCTEAVDKYGAKIADIDHIGLERHKMYTFEVRVPKDAEVVPWIKVWEDEVLITYEKV